jgi:hypothetical protein
MDEIRAEDSIGRQPKWKIIKYLLEIGSYREAIGVLFGKRYAWMK